MADVLLLMLQTSKYDFCHEEKICCVLLSSFKLHDLIFVRGRIFFSQVANFKI